jgi:prevent-host-death family protein
MTMVGIQEAKTQLSKLVERAARGEEIILVRAGKAVARLTAYVEKPHARKPGIWKGKVVFPKGFDELPPALKRAFRGDAR